ncbi:MAG TPA: DUF3108 domain-containing protein [Rhizomicrobium sp.]|jgi:hypothetical protein
MFRPILLASILLAAPAAFAAGKPATLDVNYSIAFWAIPFGHTNYEGKFENGAYDSKSHFETSGVVSLFWNSTIDAVANGNIAAHSITPNVYDSYSQDHNSKRQRVKVSFDKDAMPTTLAEPPYNTTKYPVTDEQKKGTVDPMSAIATIMTGVKADAKNPCGTGVQVFDGRRRYDVTFSYVKDEPVKLPGLFSGNVHQCQIHYNQIAGYKQKIVKEGKALPPMFIEFAEVPAAGAPNGHFLVATKLWTTLSWGTVTATLDTLKVDGAPSKG